MTRVHPYQPVLLRVVHGIAAALVVLALILGFLVYNTYDKRLASIPFPVIEDIQGIHGTIALFFLIFLPVFVLYSFHIGYRLLPEDQSFRQLKQVGKPAWWISVHRLVNTGMLLAVTFAVITGRMMKEEWLPAGEMNRLWYLAHLLSRNLVILSLGLHLLMSAKVGGVPLLLSIWSWKVRDDDTLN